MGFGSNSKKREPGNKRQRNRNCTSGTGIAGSWCPGTFEPSRAGHGPDRRLMMTYDGRLSTGLFRDRDSAERAYQDLITRGYTPADITS
jgi:hypothetical protein